MDHPRPGNDTPGDGTDRADEQLRRRLVGVDPASALTPTDPARVDRLLEDLMSPSHTRPEVAGSAETSPEASPEASPEPTGTRATGTRQRSPLTWLVAAAAVVLIAGVALFGLTRHDDQGGRVPSADKPTVATLGVPGPAAYQARCMVPTADRLAEQSVAFAGTVQSVTDGVVTLAPTRFYAGDPTDLVELRAPEPDLDKLIGALDFKEGGRYLVSASGGQVTVCGFSAPYSQQLAGLYAQAFPAEG